MARPIANNDEYNTNENRVFEAGMGVNGQPTLINNDSDPDGDGFIVDRVRVGGTTTTISGTEDTEFTSESGATVTLDNSGNLEYDPGDIFQSLSQGEEATDSFEYRIRDTNNETSQFATVNFTVAGRNDDPEAVDDAFSTLENAPLDVGNVLDNDTDVEGDTLQVTGFRVIENGVDGMDFEGVPNTAAGNELNGPRGFSLTVNEDGTFALDPGNFYNDLDIGETADLEVRYFINDGEGGGTNAIATFTIEGQAEVPRVRVGNTNNQATVFVDPNTGNIAGNAFNAGEPYQGTLFSNTNTTSQDPTDFIAGTDGDDNIWGGPKGNDIIDGGDGNDKIGYGNSGAVSRVDAGDGNDFVYTVVKAGGQTVEQSPTGEVVVDLGDGNDLAWISTSESRVTGGDGNDDMGVLSGDHTFFGGAGVDEFYGQKGAAISGELNVNLGSGDDLFFIVGESDATTNVIAGGGNDFLNGGRGADTFDGGGGNDRLFAGAGNNVVTGGGGDDVFGLTKGAGATIITDFDIDGGDLFGLTGDLMFGDLQFENISGGLGVRISTGNDELAQLTNGVTVGDLNDATNGIESLFIAAPNANV